MSSTISYVSEVVIYIHSFVSDIVILIYCLLNLYYRVFLLCQHSFSCNVNVLLWWNILLTALNHCFLPFSILQWDDLSGFQDRRVVQSGKVGLDSNPNRFFLVRVSLLQIGCKYWLVANRFYNINTVRSMILK